MRVQVLQRYNDKVVGDQWLSEIAWKGSDEPPPAFGQIQLLLDTNDPGMTFTAGRRADSALRSRAAASILPFTPKVQSRLSPQGLSGLFKPVIWPLVYFNVFCWT